MTSTPTSALLVVDVQNDFCTGGALAVPGSLDVVSTLNRYIAAAAARGVPIYASRDWHPAESTHFVTGGGPWPEHCVQDTAGARFHASLRLPADTIVVSKGVEPDAHGYSAFDGRSPSGVALGADLRARGVSHLVVGGLATDYCVRATVLDALAAGLRVTVPSDAIAGVDLQPDDSARAIAEMRAHGARIAEPGSDPFT